MSGTGDFRPSLVRPALDGLAAYEPGRPIEDVQRELGLERVVKLASNEGPFGPFPQALEALARAAPDLNRYPDGGAYRLRAALAERHGVPPAQVALGAGADGVIGSLCQATLDPGDEVVCGWPSFPSYVIDPRKLGATVRTVPLREGRYDLEAMLEAITAKTKLAFVSYPNNPTGTITSRGELDAYFARVPERVLTVLDQAYFEYLDDPEYVDGIEAYVREGRQVMVLRTFSKIYGLAGLRIGYGVGPEEIVSAILIVRRAFDLNHAGQVAALASLDDPAEVERRRRLNATERGTIESALRAAGFDVAGPAVANFVYAGTGEESTPLFEALLRLGVIVRPLHGFGAPEAIRVTVGAPAENAIFAEALAAVCATSEAPAQ